MDLFTKDGGPWALQMSGVGKRLPAPVAVVHGRSATRVSHFPT